MLDEYYDGKRKKVDLHVWDGWKRPLEDLATYGGSTPLLIACQRGMERVALRLLEIEGIRWDGAESMKRVNVTPLYAACENGMVKVCLRLLEGEKDDSTGKWKLKVDPTISRDVWEEEQWKWKRKKKTIMQVAVEKGLWEVVKRLKEVGVGEVAVKRRREDE